MWIKVMLIVALLSIFGFLAIGHGVSPNDAAANDFRKVCQQMFLRGQVATLYECEQAEARIRAGQK